MVAFALERQAFSLSLLLTMLLFKMATDKDIDEGGQFDLYWSLYSSLFFTLISLRHNIIIITTNLEHSILKLVKCN